MRSRRCAGPFPITRRGSTPNAAWSVETSIRVGKELNGVIEYLEDPTAGIGGMSRVEREVPMPLATNMCVVAFDQVKPAVTQDAVPVVLSDHHFWGGLGRSRTLAGICDAHWPWKSPDEDVIAPGALTFRNGSVAVPTAPGLGVELDRDALARLHEQYLACGIRQRDDTGYFRRTEPDFDPTPPRWL